MIFRSFLPILAVLFLLIGCNKPNPEAYRTDPILTDYQHQLGATNAEVEALKKQIEETKKNMKESVPQTGQLVMHTRKYNEMQARMNVLEQQVRFWKIRIESRAKEAQKEYLKAHEEKKPWPDPAKADAYFAEKRLRQAKIKWDQKERVEEYQKSLHKNEKAPHGEASSGHSSGH